GGDEQAQDYHPPQACIDAGDHRVDLVLQFGEGLQDQAVALSDPEQVAADLIELGMVGLHDVDVDAADLELFGGDVAVHGDGQAARLVVVDDRRNAEGGDAFVGVERQFVADLQIGSL